MRYMVVTLMATMSLCSFADSGPEAQCALIDSQHATWDAVADRIQQDVPQTFQVSDSDRMELFFNTDSYRTQLHLGAVFPTGDVRNAGATVGLLVGIDYYVSPLAPNTLFFVGGRGWWADSDFGTYSNYGAHVGVDYTLSPAPVREGGRRAGTHRVFVKLALGVYNAGFSQGDNNTGLGGWASVGFQMFGPTPVGVEVGYYIMPATTNCRNQGLNSRVTVMIR